MTEREKKGNCSVPSTSPFTCISQADGDERELTGETQNGDSKCSGPYAYSICCATSALTGINVLKAISV